MSEFAFDGEAWVLMPDDLAWEPADWPCEEQLYREDAEREDGMAEAVQAFLETLGR